MTQPSFTIGVVGLGLLGRGIVACFLGRGYRVVALDNNSTQLAEADASVHAMVGELVHSGGFAQSIEDQARKNCLFTDQFGALAPCSFVVESITEDSGAKSAAYDAIEAVVSRAAIIASNSSAIPISQMQSTRRNPERFLAMHWAEPAHATRFMEIIPGSMTTERTVNETVSLARSLGKEPGIVRKELPGFIVNRIGYAMYREALSLLEAGVADAETIDRSMRNALGLWATLCGPFRWIDITGGPELYARAMRQVLPTLNNSAELPPIMQKLAGSGARGIINGRGFFNYTPEEARHWEQLYRKHAWRVSQMQNEYFPILENPS